ncbi:MFS transporter [Roseococcus microcysteis]|uniref:MFS transporter n=1 Tax=Roseococcus microcysteis TaxID=2771361 RepID=UPI00168C0775|nr:MFS transporter [Roseococcus microcysteis]
MTTAPFVLPLLALTLGHVFSNAVRTLPAVAADVLAADLAITPETLAAITGAFPAAFALAMVPVGVALDRYGVRPVALWLLAIAGVGAALAALAPSAGTMLLAQIVLGAGCSGMLMAPMTHAAQVLDQKRFGLWSGLIQGIGNSGMLLSASPLAWLVEVAGWRAGFWACLGLGGVAFAAVALTLRARPPLPQPGRTILGDTRAVLGFASSARLMGILALAFVSFGAVLGLRGLWGGPWLMEVKGMARIPAGHVLLLGTFMLVLGPALAGWVSSRLGRLPALLAAGHLLAALCILVLLAGGPLGTPAWADAGLMALFGLAISFQVLCFAMLRARVRAEESGRALSAMNIYFFGGAAVLQALSGLAFAAGGVGAALLTFAVALVVGTALFWRWK